MKYIYLDQNKWIDLSRAYHGIQGGKEFRGVLDRIVYAVEKGFALFPIGFVHLYETLKCPDITQRQRLAEIMCKFSQDCTIAPPEQITQAELRFALSKTFQVTIAVEKPFIFGSGISFAIGSQKLIRATMRDALIGGNEAQRLGIMESGKKSSDEIAGYIEQFRTSPQATDETYRRNEYITQWTGLYQPTIKSFLKKVGLSFDDFVALSEEEKAVFFKNVPVLNVELELATERDATWSKTVDPNDTPDLVFLGVAIPYCDVVVTEKFWTHIARKRKLDEKYRTFIMKDLNELAEYLVTLQ